jgi:2-polyprenyl-3-methyl-5-hydroxy-6-metoxy-1,4-benzoquinol methylase
MFWLDFQGKSSRIGKANVMTQPYTSAFFGGQRGLSRRSAELVLPMIIAEIKPSTVIDVGCGVGTWLAVLAESGVADVWGIDGDYVERSLLQIPQERFLAHDLTKPVHLERRFDLVLCLEVAEHLPADSAPTLIDSLVSLGPVILFSAAIPYQGGINHVNEQWPEYWARHFAARGYAAVDCVRRQIWQLDDVQWYYAQNILLFVERGCLKSNSFLRREAENTPATPMSLVHPAKYLELVSQLRLPREVAEIVPFTDSFILVDDVNPGVEGLSIRRGLPFLEHEGKYWGKPRNDDEAIRELERMRRSGSAFIIFDRSSFWCLDYYAGFNQYLSSKFQCVRKNECLIAFDLRSTRSNIQS